jgi:hypothetical protein
MTNNEQVYFRRTFVCWPMKIGGFHATWPFGKIIITTDYIELSALLTKGYGLKRSDIKSIEFVKKLSAKLFYASFWGKRNMLCKITPNNQMFP